MADKKILNSIITTYRKILYDRYQYEELNEKYDLPTTIKEDQINEIRTYFLTYIYPNLDKRKELNEAFESLDNYIKNPSRLLQIIIDSTSLIFKYGRHLPKILNSGIKALRSFRDASKFEKQIVSKAEKSNKKPPFNKELIFDFIREIPREEVDQFIYGTQSLFQILYDRTQVKKIIEVISFLIVKMKKNPKTYSKEEIKGLEIGHELIVKGNDLFENLSKKNQEQLIDFIVQVESNVLDQIYGQQ